MTLEDQIRAAEDRRPTVTVYAPDRDERLFDALSTRNVAVRYRRLPAGTSGFLTLEDADGFVAAVGIDHFRDLFAPPVRGPGEDRDPALSRLLAYFDDFLFSTMDRRRLLAASREFEDRAYRLGRGTLRVGFQSLSAYRDQLPVYRTLGTDTDLDVHVYGRPDWAPPTVPNVTLHAHRGDEVGRFWFLAFDGDGDDDAKCCLVAEERDPDSYTGFWTYDPDLVDEVLSYLSATYP